MTFVTTPESSFLAPSTTPYRGVLGEPGCGPSSRARGQGNVPPRQTGLGLTGSGRREFRLGAERGAPPQWVAPPIVFILKRPRTGGTDFQSQLCPGMTPGRAGGRGGGGGESQRPDPRGGHATLTCRGRGTVFNISAGVSPFKLSSGVVLHKVLPTCSFFCMYNCLFIKGFEVLSQ